MCSSDLSTTTNAITGEVSFTTNTSESAAAGTSDVTFDNGVLDIVFAASTIDGDLVVTSGNVSGITDNGTVTVDADVTLTTDANAGVINMNQLAQTDNANNLLSLNTNGSGAATIVNATAVNLAAGTVGGATSITATSGNIIDAGTFTVSAGGATFVTSANNATINLGTLAVTRSEEHTSELQSQA